MSPKRAMSKSMSISPRRNLSKSPSVSPKRNVRRSPSVSRSPPHSPQRSRSISQSPERYGSSRSPARSVSRSPARPNKGRSISRSPSRGRSRSPSESPRRSLSCRSPSRSPPRVLSRKSASRSPLRGSRRSISKSPVKLARRSMSRSSGRAPSRRTFSRSPARNTRRSYSRSPAVHRVRSPPSDRARSLSRSPSPGGSPKRIRRGRGFSERYSYARRYRTPTPDRSPVRYRHGGRSDRDSTFFSPLDIRVTGDIRHGDIEAHQEEEPLSGIEAGGVGPELQACLAVQPVTAADAMVAVVAPFAAVLQLRALDPVHLLVQRGSGHLLGAEAHPDQDPHGTPSLQNQRAKAGRGHLLIALLERRAWSLMEMDLRTLGICKVGVVLSFIMFISVGLSCSVNGLDASNFCADLPFLFISLVGWRSSQLHIKNSPV
ncbi:hypothetical protein RJ641_022236 [Dillenia turbinata]|uniref:Uncharacterized protein n=1 Tax=Dillenia turbinata TaxID=194707 RepID=A0AAN8UBZ4_9MAGN